MENYQKKAEENLVELQDKKMKAQKMYKTLTFVWGVITFLLTIAHLAINYCYPDNHGTGMGTVILLIGLIMYTVYFLKYYKIEIRLK